MTLPMRVLYYAVGLYLLKLSDEYLKDYKLHKQRIYAKYGGNLYFKANKLELNFDSICYQSPYKDFRKRLRQEIKGNPPAQGCYLLRHRTLF